MPPSMKKPSDQARDVFEDVVAAITSGHEGYRAGAMFGMPAIKRPDGKVVASMFGDDLTAKLDGEAHAQALALPGAALFEPMPGRPMKQWVQVPFALADRWIEIVEDAIAAGD